MHSPYYTPYVLSKGNVSTLSFQKDSIQCLYTHTQRKVLHIQSLDIVNTPGADFEFFFFGQAEVLGERSYQKVMQRYIGSQEQLKICMNLLDPGPEDPLDPGTL